MDIRQIRPQTTGLSDSARCAIKSKQGQQLWGRVTGRLSSDSSVVFVNIGLGRDGYCRAEQGHRLKVGMPVKVEIGPLYTDNRYSLTLVDYIPIRGARIENDHLITPAGIMPMRLWNRDQLPVSRDVQFNHLGRLVPLLAPRGFGEMIDKLLTCPLSEIVLGKELAASPMSRSFEVRLPNFPDWPIGKIELLKDKPANGDLKAGSRVTAHLTSQDFPAVYTAAILGELAFKPQTLVSSRREKIEAAKVDIRPFVDAEDALTASLGWRKAEKILGPAIDDLPRFANVGWPVDLNRYLRAYELLAQGKIVPYLVVYLHKRFMHPADDGNLRLLWDATDADLIAIERIAGRLSLLDVRGTAVTADGIASLRTSFPGLTIRSDFRS